MYDNFEKLSSFRLGIRRTCRIMKLFVLCFALGIGICYSNDNYSQTARVSLHLKNKTVQQVLSEIEKKTEYVFFYQDNVLDGNRKVTVNTDNRKVADVLDEILTPIGNTYFVSDRQIYVVKRSESSVAAEIKKQLRQVKGKVTDESGEAIAGASVVEKGTTNGTTTDEQGLFTLEDCDNRSVLQVSFIGYKTWEIAVGKLDFIDIKLEPESTLDEVVVVGMNIRQTKRSVTGAMSRIETKELKQSPVANLNNALAGRLPGLISVQSTGEPGADAANLYIRGIGSYSSNTAPLIVVDGLPRGMGSFSQIDPNEVESVAILKDASSSALYGIQGANGVIVVTTKRGAANQKNVIDFTGQVSAMQPIRLPEMINLYDAALFYNENDKNMGLTPRFTEAALQSIRDGSEPFLYPDVNWLDEILRDQAYQNQYNVNISGSSNKVRYFASGSYLKQSTLLNHGDVFKENYRQTPKFDRYNFRSNIDIDATKRLAVQIDLAGRLEERVGPAQGFANTFGTISTLPRFAMPIYNPDGSFGNGSEVLHPYTPNPLGMITRAGYYQGFTNVLYGTLSAKHDLDFITDGLTIQSYFSFENNNYKHTGRTQNFDSYWYRGLDIHKNPLYQQYQVYSRLSTWGSSSIERSNYFDVRLNYDKQVGRNAITAQLLANRTLRVLNDELPYAYQGVSGRFVYGYNQKLFLETNLGFNGSENFMPDKRYGFFPSFSLAWLMSNERFMAGQDVVKYLKWRGSYGVVGNDNIGGQRWLYISDFGPSDGYPFGNAFRWAPGYHENRVGNSYITWERAKKSNIGFEAGLFDGETLFLSLDVFHERRTNILTTPGTVPDYIGIVNLAPRNSGEVVNRGIDGEIRLKQQWGDVGFFTNLNLTYTKNKIIRNDQPTPMFPYQGLRGYPIGYELGYEAIGFFSSEEDIANSPVQRFSSTVLPGYLKYADTNGDGEVNTYDRVPIRVFNIPNLMGGISLGMNYKNLDISMLFNGAAGGTIFRQPRDLDPIQLKRWTDENRENAEAVVASNAENNKVSSTFYLENTDYLKLRNMEIGFTIPNRWTALANLTSGRLFLNGQNLLVFDRLKIKDRDPETWGGTAIPYPIQRVFNIGLNVKF